MSEQFKDQLAIITGGASGIGLAITKKLISEGARVAVLDLKLASAAAGENSFDFLCDVTKEYQVRTAFVGATY